MRRCSDPDETEHDGGDESDCNGLDGGSGRSLGIMLADPPCHGSGGPHAQPHRDHVHERNDRFRETDARDSARAESGHEKNVRDREDALERHLQHHGDGEEENRARDGPLREILRSAAQCLADR